MNFGGSIILAVIGAILVFIWHALSDIADELKKMNKK